MGEQFQIPSLSPNIINHLKQNGYDVCYVAYYSTKSAEVLRGVVEEAKKAHLGADGLVNLVNYPERIEVQRPVIQGHFVDGKYSVLVDDAPRPMWGTYLQIMCPIRNWEPATTTEDQKNALLAVENCASWISLLHGEFVALEMHYGAVVVLSKNQSITSAAPRYIRQTLAEEHLNQAMARIVDEERACHFIQNNTAASLLRRAHKERDSTLKFLFMWLALETILGNGAARKRFALEVMKSETLNDVINELRVMREALVHDGKDVELTHRTYLKIKAVCLMGFTNNQSLRLRLLDYVTSVLSASDGRAQSDQLTKSFATGAPKAP